MKKIKIEYVIIYWFLNSITATAEVLLQIGIFSLCKIASL